MTARAAAAGRRRRFAVDPNAGYGGFAVPAACVIVGLYLVPLISVLALGFTDPQPGFGNYVRLFTAEGPLRVLATTSRICVISTVLAVVLGYVVAYASVSASPGFRMVLLVAILVPFWVSVLIRAFSWLVLLRDNGLLNQALMGSGLVDAPIRLARNEAGVLIGMVHYLMPYAALPLIATIRQIDMRVIAAAKSLGASDARTFWRVLLPMTMPGVFAATIIVFVFSLGFFVTPAILGGGRVIMVSEYVSVNVLQTLRWGVAAAQATVLLAVTLIAVGLLARTVGLRRALG